jgi:hypothetical protein
MKRPIHESHRMGKEFSDVRAPAGTPRFYGVRRCINCEAEEIAHPAGQFTDDDLVRPCLALPKTSEGKAKIRVTPKPKRRRSRT